LAANGLNFCIIQCARVLVLVSAIFFSFIFPQNTAAENGQENLVGTIRKGDAGGGCSWACSDSESLNRRQAKSKLQCQSCRLLLWQLEFFEI